MRLNVTKPDWPVEDKKQEVRNTRGRIAEKMKAIEKNDSRNMSAQDRAPINLHKWTSRVREIQREDVHEARERESLWREYMSSQLSMSPSLVLYVRSAGALAEKIKHLDHHSLLGLSQPQIESEQPDHNSISLINRHRGEVAWVFKLYSELMYCPETTRYEPHQDDEFTFQCWFNSI